MTDNVFLITVDGLRYDRLSFLRNDAKTSPRLDEFAAENAVCHRNITTGMGTRTSFPGILTSSYPLMYGGYAQLTPHRVPISEAFNDHGHVTLGVNTNAQLHRRFGWNRGYDVYYDSEQTHVQNPVGDFEAQSDNKMTDSPSLVESKFEDIKSGVYQQLDHEGLPYRMLETIYRRVHQRTPPHDRANRTVDRVFDFLDRAPSDQPTFLWVHFMEAHSPYFAPEPYREQFLTQDVSAKRIWQLNDRLHTQPSMLTEEEVAIISELYNASVRYLDDNLGKLFDGLRERGLWSDSVVAFTADHGEDFRERGGLTHLGLPYDEGVNVPMIYKLPGETVDKIETVTSTIDIGPTLLDAVYDDPEFPDEFHGHSLYSALRGKETLPADRHVFSESASGTGRNIDLSNRVTGCTTTEWKYITSRQASVEPKLFHLTTDPDEQDNVIDEYPDIRREFEQAIEEHRQQPAYTDYDISGAVNTDEVTDQLEALGYLQE